MYTQFTSQQADKILVTANSEYHMRDTTCIGVRHRRSGKWQTEHLAQGAQLVAAMQPTDNGSWCVNMGMPGPGQRMYFDNDVLTSALEEVIDAEAPAPLAA